MNFLIIGDGPDERAWAQAIRATPHRVIATVPPHEPGDPAQDFETALATANLHAAVVGGTIADRAEALRRVVMLGLPAICLHPPGATADAYYQIALAHSENPPVVVPDLPMRLHPAFAAIQARLIEAGNPRPRSVRAEVAVPPGRDLLHEAFPRVADGVWALVGAIDSLTATGAPPGKRPDRVLAVHLTAL